MNSLKIVLVFAFFVVAVIAVEEKRKELDAIKDVKSNALSTEIKKEDLKTEKKKADLKEEIEKKKEDLKKRLEIPVKEKEEEDNDGSKRSKRQLNLPSILDPINTLNNLSRALGQIFGQNGR